MLSWWFEAVGMGRDGSLHQDEMTRSKTGIMPQKRRFCKPDCGFLPEQTAMSPSFRTLAHSTAMIFSCWVNYMQEKTQKGSQWFSNSTELHIGFRKKIPSNLNNCTLGIPPEFKHGNGTCNMMIIIPFP